MKKFIIIAIPVVAIYKYAVHRFGYPLEFRKYFKLL
jgi:hypothetical protein